MAVIDLSIESLYDWRIIAVFAVLSATGTVALAVYRLFFSPLAKFPGPKLAALTQWYEFYWNVIKPGQFVFHVETLHDKYGPIVRVNPWELHIRDPDFHETIYDAHGAPRDKPQGYMKFADNDLSVQATAGHLHHKLRRAAVAPFFSKRQVQLFSPYIQACADRLWSRMATEYQGRAMPFGDAIGCLTGDVVMKFCFARDSDFLKYPDFHVELLEAIHHLESGIHVITHFPFLLPLGKSIPQRFLPNIVKSIFSFKQSMTQQIQDLIDGRNQGYKDASNATVFKELLDSNLPPHEKSLARLEDEGVTIIGAGQETTKNSLVVAAYHILNNAPVWTRLREEVLSIWPDPSEPPELTQLEQLPYLTAVIQEALRLSYGTTTRLPRISHTDLKYGTYTIPAGTPISTSNYTSSHDETIFPDSHGFHPERWLNNPRAAALSTPASANSKSPEEGGKDTTRPPLSRYLVVFSKGPRMCAGMHLAYAQMYIVLANMVRRSELRLYETEWEDVGFVRDMFVPHPRPGGQGLRVWVEKVEG